MYKPKIRQDNLLAEEVQGECVIYDSNNKKAHHLNSTLSWVWKHSDGTRTIDDLASAMQRDMGYDDAPRIIATGLKQLADANLLETDSVDLNVVAPVDSTVSRRAVMAGAAIAAPMISSILAPTPAAAKSKPDGVNPGRGPGGNGAPGQIKKNG
jgi:hypothetical protein